MKNEILKMLLEDTRKEMVEIFVKLSYNPKAKQLTKEERDALTQRGKDLGVVIRFLLRYLR